MARRILALGAALALLALVPAPAGGSTLIGKDLGALAREADRIVIARVVGRRAEWLGDTRLIYTHTTLEVSRTLKGRHEKRIVISEIGGRVGDVTCHVPLVPRYRVGERVLVFVKRDALKLWRTHGLVQGRFSIAQNRVTEEDVVRPRRGLGYVLDGYVPRDERDAGGAIALEDFVERVRALAAKPATEREAGR